MLKQRNRHPVVWLGEELAGRINSARLQLDNRSLLAEWKLAYKRGYIMQASLAIVGGFFGLVAYLSTLDWRWLLGAIVLLANWPYTIFMIKCVDRDCQVVTRIVTRRCSWQEIHDLTH